MSKLELTAGEIREGTWRGVLTGVGDSAPELVVTHLDKPLADVTLTAADTPGCWSLRIPIPPGAISEGVQTFLITERASGARLGSFTLIAGEALGDDMRVEIDLLRAELDMLKRAFRRHCVETS